MESADAAGWSAVADEWAALWAPTARPAWAAVVDAAGIGAGMRVLDVGCGSGEFLAVLSGVGAEAAGVDPSAGMLRVARRRNPTVDLRTGSVERLPWPDGSFDAVTAFNALQFADDPAAAVTELARVLRPGGAVAVANWAEGARNELEVVEAAVAAADGEELRPDGPLRREGGLETLLAGGGLEVVATGLVPTPWAVPDAETLVRGVLMGEDGAAFEELGPVVVAAASPFRRLDGSYRLRNHFRFAVARTPAP